MIRSTWITRSANELHDSLFVYKNAVFEGDTLCVGALMIR